MNTRFMPIILTSDINRIVIVTDMLVEKHHCNLLIVHCGFF